ncbi:MAG TPA: serine/threonine-protein kinase [Pseudomonadales bacterium]|nr:serine/threonine-protein kinase [Pseudomonadales bacterium]
MRATIHDKRWRYLAAVLDARLLLLVLFAALLSIPFSHIPGNGFLDRNLFKLGIKLQSRSIDAKDYLRVDVPVDEMQRFLHDPVSATAIMTFFDQLKSSHITAAKLVLHEKLWTEYRVISLLEHVNPAVATVSPEALVAIRKNIGVFQSFLADKKIVQVYVGSGVTPAASLFPGLPFFSVENGYVVPEASRYALSGLTGQSALGLLQNKTIVIGEAGDIDADDLLLNTISIDNANVATLTQWFLRMHIAIMISLLIYLFLLPFMPVKVGVFMSGIFLLAMIFSQQVVFIAHKEWFPISLWIFFLVAGHCMVLLWCVRRSFYHAVRVSEEGNPVAHPRISEKNQPPKKLWGFAQKKNMVRVAPTLMGSGVSEDFEDTETLAKTQPIKRPASSPINSSPRLRQHLGRYRIERELGRGAMGIVYLGFDPKISRQVAIKTLQYKQFSASELPAVKERFFREAAAAGKLRHPNIVTIYDVGEESDLAYIAMDYVEGDSLAAHIRKGQLLDVEQVYYIMAMVALAVHDANSQDVIHRDIKPSNILYDSKNNTVKVADFGIARILDGSATRTQAGDLIGSPLYMSPEQIKGERISSQTDIFSLGITFYQLLTGELPFNGDSLANLSYQIVQCKFIPVNEIRPDLPDSARKIIAKALQKNPENRYKTAADMYDDLHRAYSREFS